MHTNKHNRKKLIQKPSVCCYKMTETPKKSPHLYGGGVSQFQFWLLYGNVIDTDICGFFHLQFDIAFVSRDHKLTMLVV